MMAAAHLDLQKESPMAIVRYVLAKVRPGVSRETDGGEAASVRPYLAVIRDAVHRGQGGRPGVGERLGPDWHDWP